MTVAKLSDPARTALNQMLLEHRSDVDRIASFEAERLHNRIGRAAPECTREAILAVAPDIPEALLEYAMTLPEKDRAVALGYYAFLIGAPELCLAILDQNAAFAERTQAANQYTVTGTIEGEGWTFDDDIMQAPRVSAMEHHAIAIVLRDVDDVPVAAMVPNSIGGVCCTIPVRAKWYEIWILGRCEHRGPVPEDGALGVLRIAPPRRA